jgi:cytoskeletal protein CcmA (bactofilin family)
MFLKPNKPNGAPQANGAGRAGMPTIIGADFHVKGDISCQGEIQLEGTVEGNIKSLRLTVGETGVVHGDVNADGVRVQGKIAGTIRAKTVDLAGTGHVTGDILHETLSVENGAFLNGHCRRFTDEEISKEAAEAPAAEDVAPVAEENKADGKTEAETKKGKEQERLTLVSGAR